MSMARKVRCTVASVTNHSGGVYTIDLLPAGNLPSFKPGQFLHLTVDDYDPGGFWPESRVFSIASSPLEKKRIRLCYSVKGRYTRKMEQALKAGVEVWIKLPYGEFIIDETLDSVLIAGGTGISAYTAFIEALKPEHAPQVWLVYGARSPELLLFRDLIETQLARVPGFHALFFMENQSDELAKQLLAARGSAHCLPGRISMDGIWQHVPDTSSKVFHLSGPPAMLNSLSAGLRHRAIISEHIRMDAWE